MEIIEIIVENTGYIKKQDVINMFNNSETFSIYKTHKK